MKPQNLPGLVGLIGIVFAEISLLANFLPVKEWFYPIIWWSYILFIDGIIYLIKNESLIVSRTKSFLIMKLTSHLQIQTGFQKEFLNLSRMKICAHDWVKMAVSSWKKTISIQPIKKDYMAYMIGLKLI